MRSQRASPRPVRSAVSRSVSSRTSAAGRPASTTSRTTRCPARPAGTRPTGATSARSTPTTRPTWTSSRCSRSSTSTTRRGRSSPSSRRCRRLHRSSSNNTLDSIHITSSPLAVQCNSRKEDTRTTVLLHRERLRSRRRMLANTSSPKHTILSTMLNRLSRRKARYHNTILKTMPA